MEQREVKLKKPVDLHVMRPGKGSRLSPVLRKIYNLLLHRSQIELKRIGYDSKKPTLVKFSTPVSEVTDIVKTTRSEHSDNSLVSSIKQTLCGLATTLVESTSPDSNPKIEWLAFTLLHEPGFERRDDNILCLTWKLPEAVLTALSNPGKENLYSTINIEHVAKLSRYTSIALFEICNRFRDGFGGLTADKPPEWWVDALTAKPSAAGVSRPWRKLRNESVLVAIEEIRAETDLDITLIEKKSGKKVTSVQFKVQKKPSIDGVTFVDKTHYEVISVGAKLGINQTYIKELLKSYSVADVEMALSKLHGRIGSEGKSAIENKTAYLRQIIKDQPTSVMTTTPAVIPAPTPVSTSSADNIYVRMNKEFELLPSSEKQRFADMVGADNSSTLSPKLLLKLKDGIWTGMLQSQITAKYAAEKYGPDWDKNPSLTPTQGEAK